MILRVYDSYLDLSFKFPTLSSDFLNIFSLTLTRKGFFVYFMQFEDIVDEGNSLFDYSALYLFVSDEGIGYVTKRKFL